METAEIKPISEIHPRWQAAVALLRWLGLDDKRVRSVRFSAGVDEPSRLTVEYDVSRSRILTTHESEEIEVTTASAARDYIVGLFSRKAK